MRHHGVKQPHQHVGGFPYSPAVIDRRLTLELGERALERVGKFVTTYSRASGYKLHRSMTAVMGRDYYWINRQFRRERVITDVCNEHAEIHTARTHLPLTAFD